MKYFVYTAILFLVACNHSQTQVNVPDVGLQEISANDQRLGFKNGYWYYRDKTFSGTITERFADNTLYKKTRYLNGKEEGEQVVFYPGGAFSEKRYYHLGEKDGAHMGWWPNGNKRFEYHFANGIYNGDYKEWYESGKPLKHIRYTNGVDEWGKGWRENGKVYMNFVVREGRRYGLNNSNLCYTVKNGKGEYVASLK